ncbi:MAG: hypothetical protein PHH77_03505 [Victivallaceae bacterium]|nr:hypothetical protein [Victivallaceae bacterium]
MSSLKVQNIRLDAGDLVEVENQNPHPAANKAYYAALLIVNGEKNNMLLTANEVRRALQRAKKNPEDCPRESFWSGWF